MSVLIEYALKSQSGTSTSQMFREFLENLALENKERIALRYGEVTSALNKTFRDTASKTANSLQIGSIGRKTAIKGISDLDMIYIMPQAAWSDYSDGGQSKLLQDVKAAILERYPQTKVSVDRLVVTVTYSNFHIEVQPAFEDAEGDFKYPDTYNGGAWKVTKPRAEMEAVAVIDVAKNRNMRRLSRMIRAWKNKHGVEMGGLLIDTLVYKFLDSTSDYDEISFSSHDRMVRDFFDYIVDLPHQDYYLAPGSRQRVRVKKRFRNNARKAYNLCLKAIEAQGKSSAHKKWKNVFGRNFPADADDNSESSISKSDYNFRNTEEYIEDFLPVDIRYGLTLNCEVTQDGYRPQLLKWLIEQKSYLKQNKRLRFYVENTNVVAPFSLRWKVLNKGDAAKKRDCLRGQIFGDSGSQENVETTDFRGDHVVECFVVKNGVVVARDRIKVPIRIS